MPTFSRDPFGELVHEFNRVQDEVNRLFGYRFAAGGLPVNLWADDHNLYVEADLPAMDPAKLDVAVTEGNKLTIQGERLAPTVEGAVWVRQERPVGRFSREVVLPVLVDPDNVEATYEHGVLKLTLPKHEAAKPRKITVKA
jgi:HSP20 family protein